MPTARFRSITPPSGDPDAKHALATFVATDYWPPVGDFDAEVMVHLFSRCAEEVGSAPGEPTGHWRLVRERSPDRQCTRFWLSVEFLSST